METGAGCLNTQCEFQRRHFFKWIEGSRVATFRVGEKFLSPISFERNRVAIKGENIIQKFKMEFLKRKLLERRTKRHWIPDRVRYDEIKIIILMPSNHLKLFTKERVALKLVLRTQTGSAFFHFFYMAFSFRNGEWHLR
jgi:hypothetical protein